ncbi:hypothetical protein MNBD_GAMMA02-56, partial [hydrothermal vent metagenome]
NEAGRLTNGRYSSNHKSNQSRSNNNQRNGQRNSSINRSNPRAVNRGRSSGNRAINRSSGNRSSGNRSSGNRTNRASQPTQRSRQQSAVLNPNGSNYRQATGAQNSSRHVVSGRSNSTDVQSNVRQNYAERNLPNNRYQKPALVASDVSRQRVTQTNRVRQTARVNQRPQQQTPVRVKPMNSQSPVYYNNTRPNTERQPVVQRQSNRAAMHSPQVQRSNAQRSNVQAPNRHPVNNRVVQARPQQSTKPSSSKPQRKERSKNKSKSSNKSSSRNQSSRSSNRNHQR